MRQAGASTILRIAEAFPPPQTADSCGSANDRTERILLGCVACLYLPLIFAGAGSNPDSIRELHSGVVMLREHRYVMSRPPGYFPYELLCGILYAAGGVVTSNLASMLMSLALLDSFVRICAHFEVPHRHLLAATMALHPVYWAASTSTIDFIWALGCFFIGFRLLTEERYAGAAVMLALAIGIRLASVLMVAPLLIFQLLGKPRDPRILATCAATTALAAALYLPEFVASGNTLQFLTCYRSTWTTTDYLGRFLYKNLYFWGLPAAIFLGAGLPSAIGRLLRGDRKFVPIAMLAGAILLAIEALFLGLPVQRSYLLPMLPFLLILLGIAFADRRWILSTLLLLVCSFDFVNLNLARPDVPDHATRARPGFFVERGALIDDVATRLARARRPLQTTPDFP